MGLYWITVKIRMNYMDKRDTKNRNRLKMSRYLPTTWRLNDWKYVVKNIVSKGTYWIFNIFYLQSRLSEHKSIEKAGMRVVISQYVVPIRQTNGCCCCCQSKRELPAQLMTFLQEHLLCTGEITVDFSTAGVSFISKLNIIIVINTGCTQQP